MLVLVGLLVVNFDFVPFLKNTKYKHILKLLSSRIRICTNLKSIREFDSYSACVCYFSGREGTDNIQTC